MTIWFDTEITVTPHWSLNTCRGVIRCRDLHDCEDAEVLSGLALQGVTAVKHIMRRNGDKNKPSNTFILTFSAPTPPTAPSLKVHPKVHTQTMEQPPAAAGSHLGVWGFKSSALAHPPTAKLKPGPASSKTPLEKSPAKTAMKTSPTRPPKGSGDLVKLTYKYCSLDEMAMDLSGASSFSPNKGKHK